MLKITSWIICLLTLLMGFGIGIYALIVMPKIIMIFRDINAQIPNTTLFVMDLCKINVLICIISTLVINFILEMFYNGKKWKIFINISAFFLMLILVSIIIMGFIDLLNNINEYLAGLK
jgi:hypothetical protein